MTGQTDRYHTVHWFNKLAERLILIVHLDCTVKMIDLLRPKPKEDLHAELVPSLSFEILIDNILMSGPQ